MARLRVDIIRDNEEKDDRGINEDDDEEEEFLDLDILLRDPVKMATKSRATRTQLIAVADAEEFEGKGKRVEGGGGGETKKKKKRVLRARDDNPLLRHLEPLPKATNGKAKGLKLGHGRGVEEGLKREARIPKQQDPLDASVPRENVEGMAIAYLAFEEGAMVPDDPSRLPGKKKGRKAVADDDLVSVTNNAFTRRKTQAEETAPVDLDEEPVTLRVTNRGKCLPRHSYDAPVEPIADLSVPPPPEDATTTKPRTRKLPGKIMPEPLPHLELEDEEDDLQLGLDDDDDDGLSDFIVDDSEVLTEEDSLVEIPELPPPRSVRRLVRGRRPRVSEEVELEVGMKNLGLRDDLNDPFEEVEKHIENPKDDTQTRRKRTPKSTRAVKTTISPSNPSSDLQDSFTLRYSPSAIENADHITPPVSPLKYKTGGLQSPKKIPRIPSTPHRPSTDAFWSQDVINDWNDEFSPVKKTLDPPKTKPPQKKSLFKNSALATQLCPKKTDKEKKEAKKAFSNVKHALASSFLAELDESITNGEIARLSESTGGVKIIWSNKLSTTAGRANWKRETLRSTSQSGQVSTSYRHHASVELADKVIDCEERLVNVIAHEFCHLANFMVSGIKTNPHGKEFQAWGRKVSGAFAGRRVVVTTKHSYEIEYRYFWECEVCGMGFGRHSRSIDVGRHRCGVCKGLLVQIRPAVRKGKEGGEGMGAYQKFVKENLGMIKREEAFKGSPQKEIMAEVGKRFRDFKATKLSDGKEEVSVDVKEVGSKRGTPVPIVDDGLEHVVRKLDFLDLTSP